MWDMVALSYVPATPAHRLCAGCSVLKSHHMLNPLKHWPALLMVPFHVLAACPAGLGGMGLPGLDDLGDGGAALRGVPGVGGMDMGGMMQVRQWHGVHLLLGRATAWHAISSSVRESAVMVYDPMALVPGQYGTEGRLLVCHLLIPAASWAVPGRGMRGRGHVGAASLMQAA